MIVSAFERHPGLTVLGLWVFTFFAIDRIAMYATELVRGYPNP